MRFIADGVKTPERSTSGSAGYDFYMPEDVVIEPHGTCKFDTGVRVEGMKKGHVLLLFPRSSLGSKGLVITNGVGVIDTDYKQTIKAFLTNNSSRYIELKKGDRYMQGVLVKFALMDDDNATAERYGGVGSTGR